MNIRQRATLTAVAASGIVLAGCASGSTGAASSPPSASSAPSSTGAPAASGTPPAGQPSVNPGGPVASASGSVTECDAAQLRIAYTDNPQIKDGALNGMSHADSVVMFTNVGSAPCRTQGYPGVAALDASGSQIKQAARGTGSAPLITLRPGQVASAEITGNTASCSAVTKVAGFLVTAPDQRTSTRLSPGPDLCLDSLGILPLQPGNAAGLSL